MKIGFIGLGIMGKPMAKNLLKAGYALIVYDLNAEPCKELKALGAEIAQTPKALAENTELVITILPNSPHVTEVVCGKDGLLEGFRAGGILIDMSSISPDNTCKLANALEEKGVDMIDAPVSGGESRAIDGTLSIMVGGKAKTVERCVDVLRCMGSSVVHVGEIGAGNVAKLANQMIIASTLAAVSEAMQLARLYDVDEDCVRNAIKGGMAGSSVLESKLPGMIAGNFKAGFRADLQIKDLGNAIEAARAADFVPELTTQVYGMLKIMSERGYGSNDHSILYKYYER